MSNRFLHAPRNCVKVPLVETEWTKQMQHHDLWRMLPSVSVRRSLNVGVGDHHHCQERIRCLPQFELTDFIELDRGVDDFSNPEMDEQ